MWNVYNSLSNLLTGSPTQERANVENIDSFLTSYFQKNPDLKVFNFKEIITQAVNCKMYVSNTNVIKWLVNSTNKVPYDLITGNFEIKKLNLNEVKLTTPDIQALANFLRNNITIEELSLVNCDITDEKIKILADIFWFNKKITSISLLHNKEITNVGIKTLLKIAEYNKILEKVEILSYREGLGNFFGIVNIFSDDFQAKQTDKVAGFHNKNLRKDSKINETVKPILKSLAENYNEIIKKGIAENFFIVLGSKGIGKTVICYGLEGIKLKAIKQLKVETHEKELNEKIHHLPNSSTTVNNFKTSKESTRIIELPGIGDVNNQEDINAFSKAYNFWQIFALQKSIRFLMVFQGYSYDSFISNLREFIEIFKNEENRLNIDLKDKIALIFINDFGNDKDVKSIKIDNIKQELQALNTDPALKPYELELINSLKKYTFFINKAQKPGTFKEIPKLNCFYKISETKIENIPMHPNKIISGKDETAVEICDQVYANIAVIIDIIRSFFEFNRNQIINPFKSFYSLDLHNELHSEVFSKNYEEIKHCLPANPLNKSEVLEAPETFFPALKEIEELKTIYNDDSDNNDGKAKATSSLEIIRKFCKTKEHQDKLRDYAYVLEQQSMALLFCLWLKPLYSHFDPFTELAETVRKILIEQNLLSEAILDIKIKPYKDSGKMDLNLKEIKYYEEILEWLDKFTGVKPESVYAINEMRANVYYNLGMLDQSNADLASDMGKSHWLLAIREYITALEIDKNYDFIYGHSRVTFVTICKKIGESLLGIGKLHKKQYELDKKNNDFQDAVILIQEAIEYFKIGVNITSIKDCKNILKEILDKQPKDKKDALIKELHESLGEFLLKLNFSNKAAKEFKKAQGFTDEVDSFRLGNKAEEAEQQDITTNIATIKAMSDKGKAEDSSLSKGKKLDCLAYTKQLIEHFINPSDYPRPLPKNQIQQEEEEYDEDDNSGQEERRQAYVLEKEQDISEDEANTFVKLGGE